MKPLLEWGKDLRLVTEYFLFVDPSINIFLILCLIL